MARYALEEIPDPASKDALRNALGTVKGLPLVGVIDSIGLERDTAAITTLAGLLNNGDAEVADAAAVSLGRIGTPAAAKVLMAALAKPRAAIYDGLLRCAESLPRKDAAPIYDALRKSAAPQPIRMTALRSAIIARQEQGLPLLLEALRGNDGALGLAAIQAARELQGVGVTKALATELGGGKLAADRQVLLLQALGTRRDKVATPQLITVARKSDGELRATAVKSLVQIGDAAAIPVLVEYSTAADDELSKTARGGLVGYKGREVEAPIIAMLQAANPKARVAATELITQRRMDSAMPQLLVAARDTDTAVANASIRAIGEVGGNTEAPALIKVLTSGASMQAAEGALSAIYTRNRDASVTSAISAALPTASTEAKLSLMRVLRRVGGPQGLTTIRTAMNDTNTEVRDNAIRNLVEWPTADALPDLMTLAKNPPTPANKILALRGLLRLVPLQEATPEQKLATVQEALALVERPEEKRLALTALGGIPTAESLSLVTQNLTNADLKEEASLAAVTIGEQLTKTQPAVVSDAMRKVLAATQNQDLTKRAQALVK
jgi:HEAT repeat protein